MKVVKEVLNGVLVIQSEVFKDERGYFCETFNDNKLKNIIGDYSFVQDNQSMSQKNVLRGLHYQKPPFAQGKLVRVLQGRILDVVVDLRLKSPTFGKSFTIELNSEDFIQLWIPPGFAHGFLTLENNTVFFYKVSNYYNKLSEECILWNDQQLDIQWNVKDPIISEKDKEGKSFKEIISLF